MATPERAGDGRQTLTVTVDLPLPLPPEAGEGADAVGRELRLCTAAIWYERGLLSQGAAARIAGLSRASFIDALSRLGISPFQETAEEVLAAAGLAAAAPGEGA